jgi:DNA-binding response OmpR family regulator
MTQLLLVDSDPLNLRVLDVSLRKAGFEVATASDAAEAQTKAKAHAPDVLVTAARMPGTDGFALAKSLREHDAELPVLFITGADATEDRARAAAMGIEDVVARPLFIRELAARVNLMLARRGQRAATAENATGSTADVALADLLQSLEASRATGVVHLDQSGDEARIYLRDGNVVDAELGRLRGADVVVRTLTWDDAKYRVEPGPVDNLDLIECTTHALLLRAFDRIDGRTPAATPVTEALRAEEPEIAPPAPEPAPVAPVEEGIAAKTETVAEKVDEAAPVVAREHSLPSTAPWTREAASGDAPGTDAELAVAGLPKRDTRAGKRVVVAAVSLAAAILLVAGIRATSAHHADDGAGTAAANQPAAVAVEPATPPPAAPAVVPSPEPAAETTPPAEPESAEAPAPASPEALAAGLAAAAPSASGADPHEKALDVKTVMHLRNPLAREANLALLKGDTAKALSLAQQAVASNPADAEGWLTLAAARKDMGDLAGARAAYTFCIAKAHTAGVMSCRALAGKPE